MLLTSISNFKNMKNQKDLFAHCLITALLFTLIFGGCGRRPMTTGTSGEYNPPPCARYNHGTVRYENISKNVVRISCKRIHNDLVLNPRSSMEIQRIPAGRNYKVTYQDVGKRKSKTRYETFYVNTCETEAVTLR